jgi:hypothetical protein
VLTRGTYMLPLFDGRPSIPVSIPSYQMYLATIFEVIGWWGGGGGGGDDTRE